MENNFIQISASGGHAISIFKDIIDCVQLHFTNGFTSWPNDISSAADNTIFKNRAQNIECRFRCVERSAVLLKPNVATNILLFNFCEQKFVQHVPIRIAIDCNGLSLLIYEKWLNYESGPKSVLTSGSFWLRRLFNVCVLVFCAPNTTILLVYIPAQIKTSFISKDDFFLPKSASSVSRSQAPFPALFKRIHNHIRSREG